MKTKLLIAIIMLLNGFSAMAGDCQDAVMIFARVVKKFDNHHYELSLAKGYDSIPAILETTKTQITQTGILNHMGVEDRGVKSVRMQNGFDRPVQLYRECLVYKTVETLIEERSQNGGNEQ